LADAPGGPGNAGSPSQLGQPGQASPAHPAHPATAPGSLVIRLMRAGDDLEAELDLRHRAFGPMTAADREYWLTEVRACIDDERQFGVWDAGGVLLGAGRYHDMRQWWHGRALPMAGVAGVKVAPEARGLGVGMALMREMLAAMTERGYALSVLYPATAYFYRSLGWELAGGHYRIEVPGRSLGSLVPPDAEVPGQSDPDDADRRGRVALHRAGSGDAQRVIEVLGAVAAGARDCGPATWDAPSIARWLALPEVFAYLAEDGFLGYSWDGSDHEIMIHLLRAASARTARALWGVIASHTSVTEVIRAVVGPADPVGWLTPEPDVRLRRHKTWMLRLLDPSAAIAGRGFPASAEASVALLLADRELPASDGLHTLSVRDGAGSLIPGITARPTASPAAPPVRLGPRGFAALFAGAPMATLRVAGLAAGGDPGTDEVLDGLFSGSPYLLDYF
jgi:predicted acetyltransferase